MNERTFKEINTLAVDDICWYLTKIGCMPRGHGQISSTKRIIHDHVERAVARGVAKVLDAAGAHQELSAELQGVLEGLECQSKP